MLVHHSRDCDHKVVLFSRDNSGFREVILFTRNSLGSQRLILESDPDFQGQSGIWEVDSWK